MLGVSLFISCKNKTLLNNTWVKADISKEILKHNDPKPMGFSKSNSKRDVYSNTLLNNEVITEEIKGEIKKYLETNDNGDTMTQNLWDAEIGRASCRERV